MDPPPAKIFRLRACAAEARVVGALHRVVFLGVSFCAGLIAAPGFALTFDLSYDPSVASAPAGFTSAFTYATNSLSSLYSDPITIHMRVGWGEIAGGPLQPGNLGQSITNQPGVFTYGQVKAALIADATSATDFQAISTLGPTDPTGGRNFLMSTAEAKALGLFPGNAAGLDGFVGFNSSVSWTFDPNNRAVPGEYDFIGLAFHEITEVMGRYGMTQNGCGAANLCSSPIDLFRYTAPGVIDLTPTNGSYFSINSGVTNIKTFNGTGGGDLSDWAPLTADALNTPLFAGTLLPFSTADIELMDAIGYDLSSAVPEPSTWAMLLLGFAGLGFALRKSRRKVSFA